LEGFEKNKEKLVSQNELKCARYYKNARRLEERQTHKYWHGRTET